MKDKYVVALKNTAKGSITPGKVFGKYRTKEFADHAVDCLVISQKLNRWNFGTFYKGKLVN